MRRRTFIALLSGAILAGLRISRAQQGERTRRIAVLMAPAENDPQSPGRIAALHQGLEQLGWRVGRNLVIDYRWGISDDERARAAAAELLTLAPDLILTNATSALRGAREATRTVPIVFTGVSEPVAQGFVASLARPGGNATGFTNLEPSVGGKWLELLKEMAPRVARVAVIFNPATASVVEQFVGSVQAASTKLGLQAEEVHVRELAEIEAVLTRLGQQPDVGLIFPLDTFMTPHHRSTVELALRHRLPAIYPFRYFVAAGGLASYGPDIVDQFRRAGGYVDRILRGTKPGDLPVQQPTKFELVINLNTAKTLGLTVPQTLLVAADELLE